MQNPKKKKKRYSYIETRTHNILHPSELTPLASPPPPSPDNNRDNYTVRTIIAWRHGARGRANNERAPSYFHEMSHQIMAGCERAGKEQRPAAAGHKVKLRADRDSSGSLDCWPNTHTHKLRLLVRQIGSGSDDNVESWVNFLSRTRSRATEHGVICRAP